MSQHQTNCISTSGIHVWFDLKTSSASSGVRTKVQPKPQFLNLPPHQVSEEEAARIRAEEKQVGSCSASGSNSEYGSKVSALLLELGALRQQEPGAKSVVFSSWGRLLRLVGDALLVGVWPAGS